MESPRRTQLITAIVLATVFGTGMVLGYALDANDPVEVAEASEPETETETERRTPMYEQVGELSQAQRDSIDVITKLHRTQYRAGWREWRDQREALDDAWSRESRTYVEATRDLIMEVMTPDQAVRYDSLLADWDRRQAERRAEEESQRNRDRDRSPQP